MASSSKLPDDFRIDYKLVGDLNVVEREKVDKIVRSYLTGVGDSFDNVLLIEKLRKALTEELETEVKDLAMMRYYDPKSAENLMLVRFKVKQVSDDDARRRLLTLLNENFNMVDFTPKPIKKTKIDVDDDYDDDDYDDRDD